ncbi:nuclear transport factor 2 family protein [Algoriphagus mannitolivorans]|uniref:nuclear transport factor 2 family protein n=1 Tax=Algoriphagus mannitolivorans TaxID=226504 RepID=UPI00041DB9B2|nr:nuclear transport factor 2 family protein [Algoriphagus mannitolivorans]
MISEDELIGLSKEKFKTWETNDLENLEKIFDDQGLLICSNGKAETKPEVVEIVKSKRKELKNLSLQKAFARVYGNTGVVHGEGEITISIGGKIRSSGLNFLDIWMEKDGNWKLVSSHLNQVI